jgi:hypothetical protein
MAVLQVRFNWKSAPNARSTPPQSGARIPAAKGTQPLVRSEGIAADEQRTRGRKMSERIEKLKKARERMVEDRDAFAKVLAAPFDRDKAERARVKFIEIQTLIDAIDRAVEGEKT